MALNEHGTHIVSDPGADRPLAEYSTLQCVHCGRHWTIVPGSGRVRGFCGRCNGPTCGPRCDGKCVPEELMLENLARGRPRDFVPIVEAVKLDLSQLKG